MNQTIETVSLNEHNATLSCQYQQTVGATSLDTFTTG